VSVLHHVRCLECETVEHDFHVQGGDYGRCPVCTSNHRTWIPSKVNTDVYGAPQYSDATGQWHTSQRDKVRVMREAGYEEAGDKVHGARPEHRLTNHGFSDPQAKSHVSAGEREHARSMSR